MASCCSQVLWVAAVAVRRPAASGDKKQPAAAVRDKTASIITRGPCLFFQGRWRVIKSHGAPAPRARLPLYPNSRTHTGD
ncbi:hypothetical protein MRX96_021134 [Rhipicephalus microplus]